ncbi:MAG: PilZ domain-containing protein [Pyrinomonadaceae bacterium]
MGNAAFQPDRFYEALMALRGGDAEAFARLGKVTLAMLKSYELGISGAPAELPEHTTPERREAARVYAYLPAKWEGRSGAHDATISDLSTDGCFALTSGITSPTEHVKISVLLPKYGWINLCGKVTNYFEEIGFGARFVQLTRGGGRLPAEALREL